jgi:ATP citrate (pro-S)-lyase
MPKTQNPKPNGIDDQSGGEDRESAAAKNSALRDAGAIVPTSFDGLAQSITDTYQRLVRDGVIVPRPEVPPPEIPLNYTSATKEGRVRRATGIISTICDDRGEEPTYAGVPISELMEGVCVLYCTAL